MKGIADLLDSDIEDSHPFLDENSILTSATGSPDATSGRKAAQAKAKKKRHRVTMPKPKSRIVKASPVPAAKHAAKRSTTAKRKALEEQVDGRKMAGDNNVDAGEEVQETQQPKPRGRPAAKAKTVQPPPNTHVDFDNEEMEVEQTPLVARSSYAPSRVTTVAPKVVSSSSNNSKQRKAGPRKIIPESQQEQNTEPDHDEMEIPAVPPKITHTTKNKLSLREEPAYRRRAGSASDTERGDPNLRRKLGDVTRKFENIDMKYRNLKEVGINEANINMEKLRKQCDATTQASNDLIASLKKELALQAPLALEARQLKKQMHTQETETAQLRSTSTELAASLTMAQNEIKALQAKLAAARSSSAVPEGSNARTPGSGIKTAGSGRSTAISTGDAAQAAQTAQMKEELYSDLTGLIIRGAKRGDDGDTYDCIQTGRNGTLHFKLFVDAEDAKAANFEETDFLYTPLIDANRDREMIEMMPSYLTEEITFARQNAAKFYGRVLDTLTKRRADEQ